MEEKLPVNIESKESIIRSWRVRDREISILKFPLILL